MKKFLLISLSFCLILPFVFVGAFAYDPVDSPAHDSVRSISPTFTYNYLTFSTPPYSRPSTSLVISASGYFYLDSVRYSFSSISLNPNSTDAVLSLDGNTYGLINSFGVPYSHWDDVTLYFDSPTELPSSFVDWFNSSSVVDSATYTGVSSALTFGGQVLSFITSSQGILALLGLSIAMFLLVPFSIRKIKQFVKGY